MLLEEIVSNHKSYKGMELIDFAEVAMPIYRVTSSALIQEKQDIPTIDEFVLRAAHLGFKSLEEIHLLLGISKNVAKASLSSLIQSDLVHEVSNCSFELSEQGGYSAEAYSKVRPIEKQIVFDFDGILRKVKLSRGDIYLSPKEIKEQGLLEVRAIPARRPETEDINVTEVGQFLSKYSSLDDQEKTVLRIKEISRAVRLFYKAAMLIYKEKNGERVEAAFFIDGALSDSHGLSFIESDGLERLGLMEKIESKIALNIKKEFPSFVFSDSPSDTKKAKKASSGRSILSLNKDVEKPKGVSNDEKLETTSRAVRTLSVYDHPSIFHEALSSASDRLIIVSPWITKAVVDKEFSIILEDLLKKGVEVKIGYGISDNDREDLISKKLLQNLDAKYSNFIFRKFGNTHAKILIKDSDFYVITSFNWLSFKGDPNKKFREEWGNYVSDEATVKDFANQISQRFDYLE